MDDFIDLLRARISETTITQVAAQVGVSEGAVRNWLAGAAPRMKHYKRLLELSGLKSIVVPADAQNSHSAVAS